jgi:SAM-dependent methyltransferase
VGLSGDRARFAAFLDDPRAYVNARPRLDLEAVGRRAETGEPVTVTARSLLLTRDVTVQVSDEPIYVPSEKGFRLPPFHVDTYLGGFALTAERITAWSDARGKVLDLASGLALFATEAAALGIAVDCADAELGADDHPMFAAAQRAVRRDYADQLELLACLAEHGANDRYRLDEPARTLLDRLLAARHDTAAAYPRPSGRRFREDATRLATVADDTYDAVLCGWLLVHLGEDDERRVIESAVRVTKPGGEVRVRAGTGDDLAARVRAWWPAGAIGGKRATIAAASAQDLVVLRVELP